MNKVGCVFISLSAVLFGCLGLILLVSWMGPDGGGWGGLLFALFLLSGSIVCLWGARQMWLGEEK
jgi:uncharacterized membrane protein YqjE